MSEARRRWTEAKAFYHSIHEESRMDWRFYANQQWELSLKTEREDAGKPCLVNNRISTFVRNIDNQIRVNRTEAKIIAVSDATVQDAEHQEGLIKAIQDESEASIAYNCARKGMLVGGFGYSRVCTDYANWKSFDQNIQIERILDPHSVLFDPNSKRPDRMDAGYCFVGNKYTFEAAKLEYGKDAVTEMQSFQDVDGGSDWIEGDFLWFADYYYEEWIPKTLCKWVDKRGSHVDLLENVPEKAQVVQQRATEQRVIHWELLNGLKVVKKYEWPGAYIPVIPMYGEEFIVDGKLDIVGVVRYLRDPQRMLNYWESAIAQTIGYAPIAPFVGFGEVIEGYETDWESMNRRPKPILRIKAVSDGKGGFLPPPTRSTTEPPIQAMVAGRNMTEQNLQGISGLFDPSLGKSEGSQQSGTAINSLQAQGNLATYHYVDANNAHIRTVAKVVMDLAPFYYDAGRVMQIEGIDGKKKSVFIYNSDTNPDPDLPANVQHSLDLAKGSYAVAVDAQPSALTQRQDNVQFWMNMIRSFPEIMQVAGDLIANQLDNPLARQVSERLKAVLPPQVQALIAGNAPNPQAQQAQSQLQQATQLINKLLAERASKKLELDSKERIAAGGDATSIAVANINAMKDGSSDILDYEIQQLQAILGHVGDQQQMAHESGLKAMDHAQQTQQLQTTQAHQATTQATDQAFQSQQQENLPSGSLPS